jgi:hypothetical protein
MMRNPVRNETLERPRHRWVDNIKVDLVEVEWGVLEWIGLAQDKYKGELL